MPLLLVAPLGQVARPARAAAPAVDQELEARLRALLERAGAARGQASVVVQHLPGGRTAAVDGDRQLPLQSVVKLVISSVALHQVVAGRLSLGRKVRVTAADVAPGPDWMVAHWRDLPREVSVEALIEGAMVRSDSTSSDLLLRLVGGPAAVARQLAAWKIPGISVRAPYRGQKAGQPHPNLASAAGLALLLARLQGGQLLPPPEWQKLRGFMERSTTGVRRLRAGLPPDTVVADKTGTGGDGATTNDVGLITLPGGRGHLAMAVLLSGWKLPLAEQEALIADLARAAYPR